MTMKLFGISIFVLSFSHVMAGKPERYSYKTRGNGAYAYAFQNIGDCGYKSFDIYASEYATKDGGAPNEVETAWFYYYEYDWCTGKSTWGYADLGDFSFVTSAKGLASLTADFGLAVESCKYICKGKFCSYECTSAFLPVTVDVKWVPTGATYTGRNTYSSGPGSRGYVSRYQYSGTYYECTVTFDELTVDGKAFIPESGDYGVYGQTYKSSDGSFVVYRPL
jgi:hypothetical protein